MFRPNNNIPLNISDEELMVLICKKHKAAFNMLYERYFCKLVRYAFGILNNQFKAEDIVQEVFIKIIEAPESFDATRTFSTWVYTITGNKVKNILRGEQNHQTWVKEIQLTFGNSYLKPHHQADTSVIVKQLKLIYDGLSAKEKQLFNLRFEQKLSIQEVADILDLPLGSVKSGIHYLLKKYNHLIQHIIYEN